MYQAIKLTTTVSALRNLISRSPLQRGFPLIAVALACFALSPMAQAVSPPPDGGYPNQITAEGDGALFSLTSGVWNTAVGYQALYYNTTGSFNTANGAAALFNNSTGSDNTATGVLALASNTIGNSNTATGESALQSNTTGSFNTANGLGALNSNTTGGDNTATGFNALLSNTTANDNTANGFEALNSNTTGSGNTANGSVALVSNTTGSGNTANGAAALDNNTTGSNNTATGVLALVSNTTGGDNTADGANTLIHDTTGSNNTAEGFQALNNNTTGSSNTALGFNAGSTLTTGNNNIDIGNIGVAGESKKIRIGTRGTHTNTYIAGISGVTVAGGVGVIIDTNGHLGTIVSSERFKQDIHNMDKASEAILALKPVTFRYKHELDPDGIPQFGLVAEQVEKVNPDLVARDAEGKVYTVRYEAVNAMLLNEFLKEHRKVEEQEATIAQQRKDFQASITKLEATVARQEKRMEALTANLKEQGSEIRKVSAQLEVRKPAPQIVVNDQ
jgi:trimeric autotransporter adhesin